MDKIYFRLAFPKKIERIESANPPVSYKFKNLIKIPGLINFKKKKRMLWETFFEISLALESMEKVSIVLKNRFSNQEVFSFRWF